MSYTSQPILASELTTRVTAFSLPGTGVAEMMTQEPDIEQALNDLVFAADYQGEDLDTAVSAQAQELLELITAQ